MSILFGHPTGNPLSHNAALAHYEAGRLAAFCVPWMPSGLSVEIMRRMAKAWPPALRLARRRFAPLANAPKRQGRLGEWRRLLFRSLGRDHDLIAEEANQWLMRTMSRACQARAVTAVHAYEDCSLQTFETAKRLGKACIYDLPIGYHKAWEPTRSLLVARYADWLPSDRVAGSVEARFARKSAEIELADLTLAPSRFVEQTIRTYHPNAAVALTPYGVDTAFWIPGAVAPLPAGKLRFISVGHLSIRKGTPLLLEAWKKAGLRDAELELVGPWKLAEARRRDVPGNVAIVPPLAPAALRERYCAAHVFVFPSFFEGLALVLLEAMACGLPAIASDATGAPDILDDGCGRIVPAGDADALVEALRWFSENRDRVAAMGVAARALAEQCSWENYRRRVSEAVSPLV